MSPVKNEVSNADTLTRAAFDYQNQGWCEYRQPFPADLLAEVKQRIEEISRLRQPEVVYEDGSDVARGVHGCHRYDEACAALVRSRILVDLAETLIGSRVYVYQFKANIKAAREGREWPWHQDFAFWLHEDGMPSPDAVTIAINLDEAHESNGPLRVLDGTHRLGVLESVSRKENRTSNWKDDVSSNLSHAVPPELIGGLLADYPMSQFTGLPGTITAFHPCIVHSSSNNHSNDRRSILFVTYNSVDNAPTHATRPDFLVDPDTSPL
ncbi:phytanoyl-CoA dioxygenase family protein [Amycolatopsis sp. lyj-112]|uniref:phytanoyl-CoA dioxygenase family protein n=1 Tax=Amycolatopsis sp. lyj-112 TaxID=2789288 RepID=UPI00397AC090